MTHVIAVEELRVGMFIQLEGGWLSHPFPLSSFKLSTPDQIETVRKLGLRQVAWVREKSDLEPAAVVAPQVAALAATPDPAGAAPTAVATSALQASDPPTADSRNQPLLAQRESSQRCERQHQEAQSELRRLMVTVSAQPEQAGRACVALTQAMLDKMLEKDDVGIRLVEPGTDREAAHAMNVGVISLLIARAMEVSESELLDIGVGALLHDAGKSDLQPRYRQAAPGASNAEVLAYRDHVAHGVRLGQRMGLPPGALLALAQHHEHADGSGFPQRLIGDQISLAARVVSIVDRYDTLVNPIDAASGLTPHEAVAMLFAQFRHRFDATVLNAFIRMIGVYPAGSLVQLTDDRYALVMGSNSSRPLKPRVWVYEPSVPRADALLLDLEQQSDLGIRRSLSALRVPAEVLQYLDPRPRVSYFFEPLGAHGLAQGAAS